MSQFQQQQYQYQPQFQQQQQQENTMHRVVHDDGEKMQDAREPYQQQHPGAISRVRPWYKPTNKKIASIVVVLAIVLILAGSGTQSWAQYTINGVTVDVGLWSTCIDGQGCKMNDWADYAICGHTANEVRDRFQSIIALGLAGSLCGLIYLIAAHRHKTATMTFLRFGSLIAFVIAFIAVLALFVHTWTRWYFCGGDLCDYFKDLSAPDCSWKYSHSLFMAGIGMPFAIIAFILNCVSFYRSRTAIDRDGRAAPTGAPDENDSDEVLNSSDDSGFKQPTGKFEVPDGEDWRFDPISGFWWSDSHHLYFNDATGNYYDPDEQSWFDPVTGEWS